MNAEQENLIPIKADTAFKLVWFGLGLVMTLMVTHRVNDLFYIIAINKGLEDA